LGVFFCFLFAIIKFEYYVNSGNIGTFLGNIGACLGNIDTFLGNNYANNGNICSNLGNIYVNNGN
jgi:hypothetical protein